MQHRCGKTYSYFKDNTDSAAPTTPVTAQFRRPKENCMRLLGREDMLCYRLTAVYLNNGTSLQKKKAPSSNDFFTIMFSFPLKKWLLSDAQD